MAGPPKSRGMIMYVLKNMMDSFKVNSRVANADISQMLFPGWAEGEGGDLDGERSFWQLLLRVAGSASGPSVQSTIYRPGKTVSLSRLGKRMPTRWYDTSETNKKEVLLSATKVYCV